jgi:hypothetical protein
MNHDELLYREALCLAIRLGYLAGVPVRELGSRLEVTSGWPLYAVFDAHGVHAGRVSAATRSILVGTST